MKPHVAYLLLESQDSPHSYRIKLSNIISVLDLSTRLEFPNPLKYIVLMLNIISR